MGVIASHSAITGYSPWWNGADWRMNHIIPSLSFTAWVVFVAG